MEMEESRSYRYGDRSFPCIGVLMPALAAFVSVYFIHYIVHGFVKTKYSVVEGETLDIVFERNAKGTTKFPLLTIEGRIISEGDEDGKFQHTVSNLISNQIPLIFFRLPASLSHFDSERFKDNFQFDCIQ